MSHDRPRWASILALGGLLSLCCLSVSAFVGGAAVGGTAAVGLRAGFVQIAVTALTVGVLAAVVHRRLRR